MSINRLYTEIKLRLPEFEAAVLGVTMDGERLIYSCNKIISILEADGMSLDDAVEYLYQKVIKYWDGTNGYPVFVWEDGE
jgi:hypothetical protein